MPELSPAPDAAMALFRVPTGDRFDLVDRATAPPPGSAPRALKRALSQECARIDDLQRRLYAEHRRALLLIFQGMDAAGKDSTIRKVFRKVDPAGISVHAFKQPSTEELDHDFLWRTTRRLPRRGHIGVFNRSYYEELLIVRVHPQLLEHQQLPPDIDRERLWAEREESIRAHECHLARNGTRVLKFWLHVSPEVQRDRFMARLEHPEKHHKFSLRDVEERQHWPAYQQAASRMLAATSRECAPWFVIPADDKPYMRLSVARVVAAELQRMNPQFPPAPLDDPAALAQARRLLERSPRAT